MLGGQVHAEVYYPDVLVKRIIKQLLPESAREWSRKTRAVGVAYLAQKTNLTRGPLSFIYLRGSGIEIGAYNWALMVPKGVKVTQVDREPVESYANRIPDGSTLVKVDVHAMIEDLAPFSNESQDFVIANHVVEHSENPILAMQSMFRVLKPGGILFLTLPDKRFTFDIERPRTDFEHVLRDYQEGPEVSRLDHYREAAYFYEGLREEQKIAGWAEENMSAGADIHFHVWTQADLFEFLSRLQLELGFPFDIEAMSKTGLEAIFVLRKLGGLEVSHLR
jgi:SAM-dependent methyltransferase